MRSISEQLVEWDVLPGVVELNLPLQQADYPVYVQFFTAGGQLVYEGEVGNPPLVPLHRFTTGIYTGKILKDQRELHAFSLHIP